VATATADVAKAKLALAQAKVNLDNATLVAPISGTIATMPFTAGHTMKASDAVKIVGAGSIRVSVDISETSMNLVKVGQSAAVSTSAGAASPGKVTAIGILPADSTSSTASYPVTVTVPKPAAALAPGVTASVSITVARAQKTIVLPVSAVTKTTATTGTVTTLSNSHQPKTTQVVLGATGTTTIQVKSGLTIGQRVVLADNTKALPTTSALPANRRAVAAVRGAGGGAGFAGNGGPVATRGR
jgi:RND family efflux transporter MFP subunit